MDQYHVVKLGIVSSKAKWPQKQRMENRLARAKHYYRTGNKEMAIQMLLRMIPKDHPIVAWLIDGIAE